MNSLEFYRNTNNVPRMSIQQKMSKSFSFSVIIQNNNLKNNFDEKLYQKKILFKKDFILFANGNRMETKSYYP